MGVGLAAVGAGVVCDTNMQRADLKALSRVKEAVAAGSRGPGGGWVERASGRHPDQVEGAKWKRNQAF